KEEPVVVEEPVVEEEVIKEEPVVVEEPVVEEEVIKEEPVVVEEPVVEKVEKKEFENLLFDFDKSTLRSKSNKELEQIYKYLRENKSVEMEIGGHADWIGTDKYNMVLSERRSRAAANYIVNKGIPENQLNLYAFGESQPVAPNSKADGTDDPKGRQLNRRVEFSTTGDISKSKKGVAIRISKKAITIEEETVSSGIIYKVQVAAYRHPENYKNDHLADLGKLDALSVDNITRFTIGQFNSLKEARQFKKTIIEKGTKDAFITAEVDGERKYLCELNGKYKPKKHASADNPKKTPSSNKEVSASAIAAYKKILKQYGNQSIDGLVFKVQVAAYQYAENYKSEHLADMGKIETKKLTDEITRFTIGIFKTLNEAEGYKQKILEKGVYDAFVSADYNGKRILVKELIANNFYVL
ncbi:MAG: OmpA family protein, partial [Bacteroidota bacterium]